MLFLLFVYLLNRGGIAQGGFPLLLKQKLLLVVWALFVGNYRKDIVVEEDRSFLYAALCSRQIWFCFRELPRLFDIQYLYIFTYL